MFATVTGPMLYLAPGIGKSTFGWFVGAPPLGLVVPALAVAVDSTAIGLVYVRSGSLASAWLLHAALTVTLLSLLDLDATTAIELSSIA